MKEAQLAHCSKYLPSPSSAPWHPQAVMVAHLVRGDCPGQLSAVEVEEDVC